MSVFKCRKSAVPVAAVPMACRCSAMVACDGRWRPPAAVTVCGLNCMAVAPTGARVISWVVPAGLCRTATAPDLETGRVKSLCPSTYEN